MLSAAPRAPVRPRRKRQQRNCDDVDDNRRDDHAQTTAFEFRIGFGFCNHGRRRSNQSELRVVNARSNQMIAVAAVCESRGAKF